MENRQSSSYLLILKLNYQKIAENFCFTYMLIEKAIHQLLDFLEKNNCSQFGFWKYQSTKLAATFLCDDIRREMIKNYGCYCISRPGKSFWHHRSCIVVEQTDCIRNHWKRVKLAHRLFVCHDSDRDNWNWKFQIKFWVYLMWSLPGFHPGATPTYHFL